MPGTSERATRVRHAVTWVLGLLLLCGSVAYLRDTVHLRTLGDAAAAVGRAPLPLLGALAAYGLAFLLRTWAWTQVMPALAPSHAWAALHVSLLGNHVLPLRLGEALRVTSVLRRTALPARAVVASAVGLRLADVVAVVLLAVVAAPHALLTLGGAWVWAAAGLAGAAVMAGLAVSRRVPHLRLPTLLVASASVLAWVLESGVVLAVAHLVGRDISLADAVAVTAVTIAAQTVALTPGGLGTYEAAATAALVAVGVDPATAFAIALLTHAVKTAYALVTGLLALAWPTPSYAGRFRLPRRLPHRPPPRPVGPQAPIVAVIPVLDEEATVAAVVGGLPRSHAGRQVVTVVVDDGSHDRSAELARLAGAVVVSQPCTVGLGAAVRRGLDEATALRPACVVYLDADLEYAPGELGRLADPVLRGEADYVVGSRFAGRIRSMPPQRRLGNRLLTAWMRWMTRRPDLTDGQSGYRAFSPAAAAAAEIVHDYNYAQVLTLDLLAKGYVYAEVPISYSFRTSGRSFVRLGRYLRKVVPAVRRELNAAPGSVLDAVAGEPGERVSPRSGVEAPVLP